jgi:hypothetical protein
VASVAYAKEFNVPRAELSEVSLIAVVEPRHAREPVESET